MIEKYKVGFTYTVEHLGADGRIISTDTFKNLMPNPGIDAMLNAFFHAGPAYSAWYLGAYGANRVPLATDTMTTLLADCVEDTVYTGVGGARQSVTLSSASSGVMTNTASPNILAFPSSSTVRGLFLTTNVTRGSNSGLLVSAALLPTVKTPAAGEELKCYVGFAIVAV